MIGVATPAIDHAGLVDADLNTLATPLEVTIDDELKMCPELARFRPEIGLCPKLLMPSSHRDIVQALVGFTSVTRFVRHGSAQPCHLFPEVSGHNKLLRRAATQLHAVSVSPRRERASSRHLARRLHARQRGQSRETAESSDFASYSPGTLPTSRGLASISATRQPGCRSPSRSQPEARRARGAG